MDRPTFVSFRSSDSAVAARWDSNANLPNRAILRGSAEASDPLSAFDEIEADLAAARQSGGRRRWVGYVAYEVNRWIERLPPIRPAASAAFPLIAFWPSGGTSPTRERIGGGPEGALVRRRSMSRETYLDAARRAIEYVGAGDVFQVNLAQSFEVLTTRDADEVRDRLSQDAPAVYGATIEYGEDAIISNSPELFFRIEPLTDGRRRITTRPIKGTRPRGPGMREELERSEKDRAELAMIVDLERNDLGRVCEIGSVRVVEPRVIEEHPTVYHGVATIEGMLQLDVTLADVFRAMFPCGSITGCPKVRAMEIIDELEPAPRGPYCGAIGYVDGDGSAEFSVAIRTMSLSDGVARVNVGGGIVADSDPVEEHRETITKSRAMLRALGMNDAAIDSLDREP